ncbi:lactate dehydrogenase [Rhizobium sp. NBRC 114257]|uniref:Lactate dehydrogenase n=1 Tax=Rhizobium dioscoreae TaxID=2653122 RepID=A0ABQ0YZZ3_9HYPH|nr:MULTISPECIES: alpha-hydroxy acid oxidase [Rhizobium]GES48809.1 lactate dehydrogenase [Rhizobium dioscoreae]GLU80252.1 lactate dehydrogenase [Rhizobium sp. NBRC 114257]
MSNPHGPASIADFRNAARRALPKMVFDFFDGGAGSELTLCENRAALDRIRLVGSAPVDVGHRSAAISLFGEPLSMPVIIGPTGLAGAAWPAGDQALARAAARAGIPFVMSSAASATMEAVAAAGEGRKWFQLYLFRDREVSLRLLKQAEALGFEAIEITVDNAIPGRRLRDARNGFSLPFRWTPRKLLSLAAHPGWALRMAKAGAPRLEVMEAEFDLKSAGTIAEVMEQQLDPTVSWDDIAFIRDRWKGPLILKGLLNPRQGSRATELGLDGIVVSNHGGRQLDGAVASIDILPEFVSAVGGKLAILIDSGFRSGTDVAKALALGATAVQIGRATLYALASGGEDAAFRALAIIAAELDVAQAMMGAPTIADLRPSTLRLPPMLLRPEQVSAREPMSPRPQSPFAA